MAILGNDSLPQSWGLIGRGQWKKSKEGRAKVTLKNLNFKDLFILTTKNKVMSLAKAVGK